nr:MAG TPA: hypothetical protein [Caudoviricetes sp.]
MILKSNTDVYSLLITDIYFLWQKSISAWLVYVN